MKIIIDIDEEDFKDIGKCVMSVGEIFDSLRGKAYRSILNGTPLSEVLDEIETDGEIVSGSIAKIKIQNIIDKHIGKSEKGGE